MNDKKHTVLTPPDVVELQKSGLTLPHAIIQPSPQASTGTTNAKNVKEREEKSRGVYCIDTRTTTDTSKASRENKEGRKLGRTYVHRWAYTHHKATFQIPTASEKRNERVRRRGGRG
jgi:hypothetical protein